MHEIEVLPSLTMMDYLLNGLWMTGDHVVQPDGEYAQSINRYTGRDDLFIYRHEWTENFVLCQHLYDNGCGLRICQELQALSPKAPDRGGWISLERVRDYCRPRDEKMREVRRHRRAAKSLERKVKEESREQRYAAASYLKNRGMYESGLALEQDHSYVGTSEGGDTLGEMTESLKRMARMS